MPQQVGVFLQLGSRFLLSDPRWSRLSDAAQGLWLTIEAISIEERREFIAPEWTAEELASVRRRTTGQIDDALLELQKGPRPLIYSMPSGRIRATGIRKHHGARFSWRDEFKQAEQWNKQFATAEIKCLDPQDFAAVEVAGCKGRKKTLNDPSPVIEPSREVVTDVDVDVKAGVEISKPAAILRETVQQETVHTTEGLNGSFKKPTDNGQWHADKAIHEVTESLILDWPSPGRDKVEPFVKAILARGSWNHALALIRDISEKFKGKRKCKGRQIVHPWLALKSRLAKSEYTPSDTDLGWAKEQVVLRQQRGPPAERGGEPEVVAGILKGDGDE